MPELKPCPFCGGEVELKDCTANFYGFQDYEIRCKCGMRFRSGSTCEHYFVGSTYHTPHTERQKKIAYDNMIADYNRRRNMTDNEIIKALVCCTSSTTSEACNGCPLYDTTICTEMENGLQIYALDLINRQKAEIERLKAENDEFREIIFTDRSEAIKMLKTEAIKEFAKELKRRLIAGGIFPVLVKNEIDSLVKEMTEDKNDR